MIARLLRYLKRALDQIDVDPDELTTVYVVEDQDPGLLCEVALAIFGYDVWYADVDSEEACDELNAVGERYDLAYSQ